MVSWFNDRRVQVGDTAVTQILLMRPGSTDYDRQRRIKGRLDLPLSDEGRQEVASVLRQIDTCRDQFPEVVHVYGAPTLASRETMEIVAAHFGVKAKTVDRLHNLDAGLWQGRGIDEIRSCQPKVYRLWQEQPESVCPPQGEMLEMARLRAREAVAKICKKHRGGAVVIVLPEPMQTIVRSFLTGMSLGDLWQAECAGSEGMWIDVGASPAAVSERV
jgi:probable phosphoglycerate mutase